MQRVWRQDALWKVLDCGQALGAKAEANVGGTTLTLLEMNSSHLPVIENAIARVEFFAQSAGVAKLPSVLSLVDAAQSFRSSCLNKVFNTAAARSQSDDFR
jgi:hypothetical protein